MKLVKTAIVLTAIGVLLCLWLLVGVTWYNFAAFMLFAQPVLLAGGVIFIGALIRALRQRDLL